MNPSGFRFSGYFLKRRAEAAAMGSLLVAFPRMHERVRGIDLCTDELGIPLWVLLPLMQHVRRASVIAETTLRGSKHQVSRLRMTVHAGEDFVHLLGSIRRVGEAVQYLGLREGDRIGHGVALGVDVNEWAERSTMRSDSDALRVWLPWAGQKACRLAREIFGSGFDCSAVKLDGFVTALHSTPELARAGFPTGPSVPLDPTSSTGLLAAWLRDRRVFERAQVPEPALRRIRKAAESGALELDLSGLKEGKTGVWKNTGLETLTRLPQELKRLTLLQSLNLSFCKRLSGDLARCNGTPKRLMRN